MGRIVGGIQWLGRCLLHNWGQWKIYEVSVKVTPGRIAPKAVQGQWFDSTDVRQQRQCTICGKTQDVLVRESM